MGLGKDVEPDLATLGHGLLGMNEADTVAESLLENANKLAGEGDLGDEEDDRLAARDGIGGELEVNVGLAATGDATEKASVTRGLLELGEGALLSGVEGDFGQV